jgi:hypothetical protein
MNESKMSQESLDSREERLDALFKAYRVACEPPETSVNFMPELWAKIESSQNATFSFRRIAKGFVTAAIALSMVLAIIGFVSSSPQNSPVYHSSYVDALAAHNEALDARNSIESAEYLIDLMHPDSLDDQAEEI